jgi:hypothetical protein
MESQDVANGPLEFLFTIDEESGLTGASGFPDGVLQSKYFLNLDGEEEGTLCIGCAGGLNTVAHRKLEMRPAGPAGGWRIKVSGLQGGHSGLDINKGRGNAIAILGRTLLVVMDRLPGGTGVATIKGGSKRNAIPREASATVLVEIGREEDLRRLAAEVEAEILSALGSFDPGVSIAVESAPYPGRVFARSGAHQVVGLLASLPHGVLEMSPDVPGLVQTSTNLAIVSAGDGDVEIETSQRSSIESSKLHDPAIRRLRGAAGRRLSRLEARAVERHRPPGPEGSPRDPGHDPGAGGHARRPGVRRHRGKAPRHADDLVRAAHRGRPQPQRASQNLIGRAVLEVPQGPAGEPLAEVSQATKRKRRMRASAAKHPARSIKVAIDFPAPLFTETERAAHELSVNRSQLIRSAVEIFLRRRKREKLERAIAESFQANRDLDRQLMDEFRHVDVDAETGL